MLGIPGLPWKGWDKATQTTPGCPRAETWREWHNPGLSLRVEMLVGQKSLQSLRNNDSHHCRSRRSERKRGWLWGAHGAFQVGESTGFYCREDEKHAWDVSTHVEVQNWSEVTKVCCHRGSSALPSISTQDLRTQCWALSGPGVFAFYPKSFLQLYVLKLHILWTVMPSSLPRWLPLDPQPVCLSSHG